MRPHTQETEMKSLLQTDYYKKIKIKILFNSIESYSKGGSKATYKYENDKGKKCHSAPALPVFIGSEVGEHVSHKGQKVPLPFSIPFLCLCGLVSRLR